MTYAPQTISASLKIMLLALMVVLILIAIGRTMVHRNTMDYQDDIHGSQITQMGEIFSIQLLLEEQINEWNMILLRGHDLEGYHEHLSNFYSAERMVQERALSLLSQNNEHAQIQDNIRHFIEGHKQLGKTYRDALRAYNASLVDPQFVADVLVSNIPQQVKSLLTQVTQASDLALQSRQQALKKQYRSRELLAITIFMIVSLSVIAYFLRWIDWRISKPLAAAAFTAGKIGKGDFSTALPIERHDEVGTLLEALNNMQQKLSIANETVEAARQEAVAADQAKSRFLAAASHDMRQPVQAITYISYMLKEKVHDQELIPLLNQLNNNTEAVITLLDNLLDISKLDAGVVEKNLEDIPMGDLFNTLENTFSAEAKTKGLELCFGHCPSIVVSDRILLGRILQNLVANAIKYTEQGKVQVNCRQDNKMLSIEIQDSGKGIEPQHLNLIFDEFYQVANQARDRRQGLGLGLALVKRLCHLLHHPIQVSSNPGTGSLFSVKVPMAEQTNNPYPATHKELS